MRLELIDWTTFSDDRGTIQTYLPPDPIVEFNLVTLKAGEVRGMHWHPHFTEYLLFVSGQGILRWRDRNSDEFGSVLAHRGAATRAEPGIAHAVRAKTDMTFIAMLTRRWDESHPPIVKAEV